MEHKDLEGLSLEEKKALFREATVMHRFLEQTDRAIMRAIGEHGGFAHVLVYGPSGVGKTTMIRQIARRFNGTMPMSRAPHLPSASLHGTVASVPVLVLETRPPDGSAFNRADYYRNTLVKLGEPFYEHHRWVDINSEQAWEKPTRGRGKATQFNESPELRHAMEEAMQRHGVRAVILDEAQHLMMFSNERRGSTLLDQLDWIKSMTNVTDIVHILIGTYDLLSFTRLNGQASRRGLPIHFPRYQLQREEDCVQFQAALLALLQKVPLLTDAEGLVIHHWLYFYERCIGCVGVLKDWLMRAVSTALDQGCDSLTLEHIQDHALAISQCEQMALDAVEGEQKLSYNESRREHLWQLLQGGGTLVSIPPLPTSEAQRKSLTSQGMSEGNRSLLVEPKTALPEVSLSSKRTKGRTGERLPQRDPVGDAKHEEKPTKCSFAGTVDLTPEQIAEASVAKVECPECGAMRTLHPQGVTVVFPSHPKRRTGAPRDEVRWIRRAVTWELSAKKA